MAWSAREGVGRAAFLDPNIYFMVNGSANLTSKDDNLSISTKSSLAFVYAGYFFRYLYLFILIPFYGRVLGAEAYGKVLAAMSLFNVVWLVSEYGYPSVGLREIASTSDRSVIGKEFGRQLVARAGTSLAAIVVGLSGTYLSPVLRSDPLFGWLATALGVISAFNLGWYFAAVQRFRTSIAMEMGVFAINLVLILLNVRHPNDAVLVLASLLISGVIMTAIAYWIAVRHIGRENIRLASPTKHAGSATALFVATRVSLMLTNGTNFLLSLFANAHQVGAFGAAERVVALGLSIMQPAAQVLAPTVTRRLASIETTESAWRLIKLGTALTLALGLICTIGAWSLASWIIPIIFGPDFESGIRTLQVFSLLFPFAAINQAIRAYVLFPLRKDTVNLRTTISGLAVSLIAIALAAKPYGGLGIAFARVIGEAFTSLLLVVAVVQLRGSGDLN